MKEAPRRSRIAFGREQEIDRLPGGIDGSIEILLLTLYLDIRFVDTVALVGRLQMLPTALAQLRCVGLNPAPDAAGIHRKSALGQQLGHMFVRQRVPQIPTNCRHDYLARILSTFERIGFCDRQGSLPYQIPLF